MYIIDIHKLMSLKDSFFQIFFHKFNLTERNFHNALKRLLLTESCPKTIKEAFVARIDFKLSAKFPIKTRNILYKDVRQ